METPPIEITPLDLKIPALDGFTLAASIFGASDRVITVHSAVGVPKYYYTKFARFLAGRGFTVVTYDYRGIGASRPKSLRSFQPRYQEWGTLDARAVVQWSIASLKPKSLYSICHSGGAQILGLVPELERLDGIVAVASPSGAWRHWPHPRRHQLRLLGAVLPLLALTVGYVPLRFLKIGEDIPGGVAWEWSRWSKDPDFLLGPRFKLDISGFKSYRGPLLAISIEDDYFAPREAVEALTRMYSAARVDRIHLLPSDYSAKAIGHFGFFKDYFRENLWQKVLAWLETQPARGAEHRPGNPMCTTQ